MAHKLVLLEWLYKADQDFGSAKLILSNREVGYFDQTCFFFQQSAEKYLKAFIIKFGLPLEKQHDLLKLLKTCQSHDSSLIAIEEACRTLNSYYIDTRYPNEAFMPANRKQAEEAMSAAKEIQTQIRKGIDIDHEVTFEEVQSESRRVDKQMGQSKK